VLGEVIRKGSRYVFAARTMVDNATRDFIFEGDYEKMKALLTVLKASLSESNGKSVEIMEQCKSKIDPVRVFVSMDALFTDGVKYAQQVITK